MTITPAMMSYPVGRNNSGARIIPLYADWSRDTTYVADFKAQGASLSLDQVVSVFINNEGSDNSVTVNVSGTSIPYTVQSGQVGVFPIYANGLPTVTLSSDGAVGSTTFAFANFGQSLFAYDAAQIAQSVKEITLAACAAIDPANGGTAIHVYAPGVEAALNKMAAETGLDFTFDAAGNAMVKDVGIQSVLSGGALNVTWTSGSQQISVYGQVYGAGGAARQEAWTSGKQVSYPSDLGNKGPVMGDDRLSFVTGVDATKFTLPAGSSWYQATNSNGGSLAAVCDPRMTFDAEGKLITTLDSVTIDGGSVTVNTKNIYDSSGNLLTADVGVTNLIDNYAFTDATDGNQLRVGGPSLTATAGSVAALASEITTNYGGGLKVVPTCARDGATGFEPLSLEGQYGALKTNDVYLGSVLTGGTQVTKVSGTVSVSASSTLPVTGTVAIAGTNSDGTNLMVYSADASAKLQVLIDTLKPKANPSCFSTVMAVGGKRQRIGAPGTVTSVAWGLDTNDSPVSADNKPRWLVFWTEATGGDPTFATPLAVCGGDWKGAQGFIPVNIAGNQMIYCSVDDDFPGSGKNTMSYTTMLTLNGYN